LRSVPNAIHLVAHVYQAATPFCHFPLALDPARSDFESVRPCTSRTERAYSNIIKTKMHDKQVQLYNGYAVQPSAHRLPDGTFSSNLLLDRTGCARTEGRYQFYALDYFASEEQALLHSARWARNWVDTRG
jgi:hypothetical protein